jgi:hypothetical protein
VSRAIFILREPKAREAAAKLCASAPSGTRVEFKAARRSLPQNSLLWARLSDISRGLTWYGEKLRPQDWKTVLMGAFRKNRVVPTPDGGFVMLGLSTSDLTKEEMNDFLDLISHFAHNHGVELSDEKHDGNEA